MSFISDLPFVNVGIDYDYYTRPSDRDGLVINTHFYALPPYTNSPRQGSPSSVDGEDGSNHPDQTEPLQVVDVGIDYDYYTRPSDRNEVAVNTHFQDLPPFNTSGTTNPSSSTGGDDGSNDGDLETVSLSSFASCKKPEPLQHPNAVAAYLHIMSGLLASVAIDRRDIAAEGDKIFIPDAGHTHGHLRGRERCRPPLRFCLSQQQLELSKRHLLSTASATPPVLFRGFNDESGGGLDPMLNSETGVIPHAFLDGEEPTIMWDVPRLSVKFTKHLCNEKMRSPFSSWSQMLDVALRFALGPKDKRVSNPMIAVIHTEAMQDRIWYTPDLHSSGLSLRQYKQEYLIYGPVSRPGYYCVPLRRIMRIPGAWNILMLGDRRPLKYTVQISRRIATVLQPPNANLDTTLMLTAKFVGNHIQKARPRHQLSRVPLTAFLYHVRDALQGLAMRSDARWISLAVPNASTEFSPALVFELQMLLAAEYAVHILGWTWRAAAERSYRPGTRQLEKSYCERVSETTRKRKGSTIPDSRPLKRRRLS